MHDRHLRSSDIEIILKDLNSKFELSNGVKNLPRCSKFFMRHDRLRQIRNHC